MPSIPRRVGTALDNESPFSSGSEIEVSDQDRQARRIILLDVIVEPCHPVTKCGPRQTRDSMDIAETSATIGPFTRDAVNPTLLENGVSDTIKIQEQFLPNANDFP